ncbi:MAG: hypothetical protein M1570_15905 [Chloroflexi bacterium]|nr:hypothetical protein [Chloroflexota bacterium]
MFFRILGTVAVLIASTYVVQAFIPSTRGRGRPMQHYLAWDIAPLVGFIGVVLLALSFIEADRQQVIYAWAGGGAFGFVAAVCLGIAFVYTQSHALQSGYPAGKREGGLRRTWRYLRTYGPVLLIAALAFNLAVRWVGAALEVFAAGTAGVLALTVAVVVVAAARRSA